MRKYVKNLRDIFDFYNSQSCNVMTKIGEGLKILTNKQMLNRLPILLTQVKAGSNSNKLKMKRDKYYTRYTGQKH